MKADLDERGRARGGRGVDMTPRAIALRLRRLEQLFRLGVSLRRARLVGPVEPQRPPKAR